MLVRSVCTSQACNFQDENQPGLQLVEKLATPLSDIIWPRVLKWGLFSAQLLEVPYCNGFSLWFAYHWSENDKSAYM